MPQQIESELKWALSAEGHDRLLIELRRVLPGLRLLDQHNWFFDAADSRLRRQGMNVRVRVQNGQVVVTCKRKLADSDAQGLHRHDEWEQDISIELWQQVNRDSADPATLLPLPAHIHSALDNATLVCLGGFANQRHEGHDSGPGASPTDLICLDRTSFPGDTIDHELEIETGDAPNAVQRWRGLLQAWGIAHNVQPRTKFARFLTYC